MTDPNAPHQPLAPVPAPPRRRFFFFAFGAIAGALFLILQSLFNAGRVVAHWSQPGSVNYQGYDLYTLSVLDQGLDLTAREHRYELFIGRGADAPAYGHYTPFHFHFGYENEDHPDAYISRSTVSWTAAGLTFTEPEGHALFIPARAFIGGR